MSLASRVARRFIAEKLTKQWLMGIRRGWLQRMKPSISSWDDVERAIDKLQEFSDNLWDQAQLVRRGIRHLQSDTYEARLEKAFKTLNSGIARAKDSAAHWRNVEEDPETYGRGTFTKDEGEQMFRLFRDDFSEATGASVPKRGGGGLHRPASLVELMDKILTLLREDAAAIQKHDEDDPDAPWDAKEILKEFSIGKMKFILVLGPNAKPSWAANYMALLKRAYALVQRKGIGHLWYGLCFLSPECEKLTEEHIQRYEAAGYDRKYIECRAGWYRHRDDTMAFTSYPTTDFVGGMIHELGHRHWYKFMFSEQRARFESLLKTKEGPESGDQKKALQEALKWLSEEESYLKQWTDEARFTRYSLDRTMPGTPWGWFEGFHENADTIVDKVATMLMKWRHPDSGPELRAQFMRVMKAANKVAWLYRATSRLEALIPVLEGVGFGPEKKNNAFVVMQVKFGKQGQVLVQRLKAEVEAYFRTGPGAVEAVSDYGSSNSAEAFAEAFAYYLLEKGMTRDQIESFRAVLARQKPYKYDDRRIRQLNDLVPAMEFPKSAQRVAHRFIEADEPFKTLFDLERFFWDNRSHGWKKEKAQSGQESHIKRFNGIWYRLSWDTSVWASQAYLYPTTTLKISPTDEAWKAARDKVSEHFPIKGLTIADIERKAMGLAKAYKELAGPRQKRDTSGIEYRSRHILDDENLPLLLTGDEALKAWRGDVEESLQGVIDEGAPHGQDYSTADLVDNLLNNYGLTLRGGRVTRRDEGRLIRAILESMAKRKKIEKDTNAREPRWLGLNYKSKPRSYW